MQASLARRGESFTSVRSGCPNLVGALTIPCISIERSAIKQGIMATCGANARI